MNERVKLLRKTLNLSGEKFGERLGIKKNSVSQIENGVNNLTEQMIKSICREFNVNEDWLRNGNGDMFISSDTIPLDELINNNQIDELELQILKAYFSLDKDIRKKALEHFKKTITS